MKHKEPPAQPTLPPHLLLLLLRLTPHRWRDEMEGDLLEGYRMRLRLDGAWRARLWCWRQVCSFDVLRLRRSDRGRRQSSGRKRGIKMMINQFGRDIRYALRRSAKNPGFTALILLTLALGIGATTAVFSLVYGVLLKPLPYQEPERLAMVFRTVPRLGFTHSVASYPDFADWSEQAGSFKSLAAYGRSQMDYQAAQGAERWVGSRVTTGLFPLLGVEAEAGRTFLPEEDRPGAEAVILLSFGLWQSRFGGEADIVGRQLRLEGRPVTVVGVMPSEFGFPSADTAYWVPLRGDLRRMERDTNFLSVIGRLAPGVSVEQAQTEMTRLAAGIDATAAQANQDYGIFVESRHGFQVRNARTALLVFLGAVALVLLIACTNVANLMLVRGAQRQREVAVRAALGAGRGRLAAQVLTESALLSLMGAVLGVGLAAGLLKLLAAAAPSSLPRLDQLGLNPVVLSVSVLLSLACGIAFGAVPALIGSRSDVQKALREGIWSSGLGKLGSRLQPLFAVSQVALALVLTVGASLLLHSFMRLTWTDPGFESDNLLAARIAPPRPNAASRQLAMEAISKRQQFFQEVRLNTESLPGIQATALGYSMPFGWHSFSRSMTPMESPSEVRELNVGGNAVSGDYFRVMGIPMLRGRTFDQRDRLDGAPTIILNQSAANLFWPGQDPVGKQVDIGSGSLTASVVGLVSDVSTRSLGEDPQPFYFRSIQQAPWVDGLFLLCRLEDAVSLEVAAAAVRQAVWEMDASLPVTDVATAAQLIEVSVSAPRFRTLVLGSFGAVAVLLALVGIYGVIAQAAGQRTREIGIRMALGAGKGRIMKLVLSRGLLLTSIGIGAGLLGALALARFLEGMLFGLTPHDPLSYIVAVLALASASLLASYLPARRASGIDPLESLRCD